MVFLQSPWVLRTSQYLLMMYSTLFLASTGHYTHLRCVQRYIFFSGLNFSIYSGSLGSSYCYFCIGNAHDPWIAPQGVQTNMGGILDPYIDGLKAASKFSSGVILMQQYLSYLLICIPNIQHMGTANTLDFLWLFSWLLGFISVGPWHFTVANGLSEPNLASFCSWYESAWYITTLRHIFL